MWLGLMGSVPPAFVPPGETEATFLRKILPLNRLRVASVGSVSSCKNIWF